MLVMLVVSGSLRLLFQSQVVCRVKNGQVNRQVRQLPGLFEDGVVVCSCSPSFPRGPRWRDKGDAGGPFFSGIGGKRVSGDCDVDLHSRMPLDLKLKRWIKSLDDVFTGKGVNKYVCLLSKFCLLLSHILCDLSAPDDFNAVRSSLIIRC